MIGGYGVLDKYLKSHKNESCDFDHVSNIFDHVSNIIKVIARTIEIQKTLGFLTSDLPHLKGNDSQALMQEILQNPPPPPFKPSGVKYRKTEQDTGSLEFSNGSQYTNRVLLHNLWGNNAFIPNLALICDRGSKVSPISNLFVTNMLCDLHVNGSGSYAFLLYRLT
ncbi:hypothetical protein CG4_04900 [Helicobacter pylori]